MFCRPIAPIAYALLLSALCCACAGGKDTLGAAPAPLQSAVPEGSFPAPSALALQPRTVSYVEADLNKQASQYSNLIPPNRVQKSGGALIMSPAVFPGKLSAVSMTSYALYDFTLAGYDLDPVMDLDWLRPPEGPNVVFAGLANFSEDRWDWFPVNPGEQLVLPSFGPYIHAGNDRMFVVVLATGFTDVTGNNVRVGRDYDEFESSDPYSLNILSDADFSGYKGSVGTGLGYDGYDGDDSDKYVIYVIPGDTLTLTLNYNNADGDLSMSMEDGLSSPLGTASGPSPLNFVRTFGLADVPPFFLDITSLAGYSEYTLDKAVEHAPVPRLKADAWQGSAPLLVNFDAANSFDPDGSITLFEWDWNGDGVFEEDSGTDPTLAHTYNADGNFRATLRITDNDARQSVISTTVTVGSLSYDEIENNDVRFGLTKLPAIPFSGYRGSVGTDGGYPGYDGDDSDGFDFYPSIGQEITFTITYDPLTAPDLQFVSADTGLATLIYGNTTAPGVQSLSVTRTAVDRLPYILQVYAPTGYSDYELSADGGLAPRPALAVNLDAGLASPLEVSFDASDSADDGSIVKFEWDWNGDFVYDLDTGSVPTVVHSFSPAGNYDVHLRLTDDKGLQAGLTRTIYAWPSPYDEKEPNNYAVDNVVYLPALPVTGFKGSLGTGQGYDGYDGSHYDYFYLDGLQTGDTVTITVTSNAATGDMYVELQNVTGMSGYGSSNDDDGSEQVVRVLSGVEQYPLVVQVSVDEGQYTDYTIDISKS